jgi:uncharacterized protein YpmS
MSLFKKKWRAAFLLLASINIIILLVLVILALLPADRSADSVGSANEDVIPFQVTTNKEDLTLLINRYLEKEGLNGPVHYEVNLNDEVELFGYLPIFSSDIEMKLTFEPIPLENGDLTLKQKSISIGQLSLPVSYVMKFIENQYKLPSWVNINPDDETIDVHLTNMKIGDGMAAEVEEFDLKNDQIRFNLLLPIE